MIARNFTSLYTWRIVMSIVQISQAQGHIPVTVFHLQDRINLGNTAEMEKAAQEAFESGVRDMVIDLTKTPSITSAGIRSLVVIFKMFSADGAKHVKLAGVSAQIREIFEIAGITEHIEVFETVDEAVDSF
jgi:anti-anti-sigma factor